ncbi:sugar ABC transporter substrate-binding protein [Rathayibacter sp. VKM Ac-2760]|uniref:ABC transporter substrate-binding protein n=1 Tax=Rathayibacter sp. VKM Ac-2760 TaxID=2609253 RepID=UPI001ABDD863|nr:sugar ABC transporter substrate-binding protein [Rathayibacter sp. VKM Ac-2760]
MLTPALRRATALGVGLLATAVLLTACQSGPAASTGGSVEAVDDGTTIQMWTRSSTSDFTQALVDKYNETHENQVELTVVPFDAYQQKVATAAGAGQLPDIVSSDVVYTPDYVAKGLFRDITAEIDALPFAGDLAPGHMAVGTSADGKKYAVPHDLDLSAIFYNKVLFRQAGLDPDAPPTDLKGWFDAAAKIDALGDGTDGFYFGGNCGGCMLFTTWPSIWADGGDVLGDGGTSATLDSDTAGDVYSQYRAAWEAGLAPQAAQTETGATFGTAFGTGKIGWQILGATAYASYPASDSLEVGIAPVPGVAGGESTFVGGDTLSISSTSEHAAAAWDFLSWTLGDEAQIDVIAAGGNLPARTDLADNEYSAADPNVAELARLVSVGETPVSAAFGSTFNDANGPWTAYFRDQIFGDASKRSADNDAISSSLGG